MNVDHLVILLEYVGNVTAHIPNKIGNLYDYCMKFTLFSFLNIYTILMSLHFILFLPFTSSSLKSVP